MTVKTFVELFLEVTKAAGASRSYLPVEFIAIWEQFVGFCEEGYDDNIYEYENDLRIRDRIEYVIHDERLRDCPEMNWVREQVEEIDVRFRSLLQEQGIQGSAGRPWWRHPPKYAGKELASDFLDQYGIHVEVVGS